DAAEYPQATRKIPAWGLLARGRSGSAVGRLRRPAPACGGRCSWSTRWARWDPVQANLRGLVGQARLSGLAVVLATQGASGLEAVDALLLARSGLTGKRLWRTPWLSSDPSHRCT